MSQRRFRLRTVFFSGLASLGLWAAGCGTPYRATEALTLALPADGERLIVRNHVGDVVVIADSKSREVRAEITEIGKGASPAEADHALDQIETRLEASKENAKTLVASATHPNGNGFRQYEVQWRIAAPPDLAVEIRNEVGKITVQDMNKGATLHCDVGDICVTKLRGGLTATSNVGDIDAEAAGSIRVRTDVGDARLHVLADSPDNVVVATNVGDVTVCLPSDRKGCIDADTDVGNVHVRMDETLMNRVRHRRHHFGAQLGGEETPRIELSADVGDVRVRAESREPS